MARPTGHPHSCRKTPKSFATCPQDLIIADELTTCFRAAAFCSAQGCESSAIGRGTAIVTTVLVMEQLCDGGTTTAETMPIAPAPSRDLVVQARSRYVHRC